MITLETGGSTNDLIVSNGQLIIISDEDQIAQSVRETLATFFGEWFLNTKIGLPWFQQILVSNPNLDTIQFTLINAVTNVPGVAQLNNFQFSNYDNARRSLTITLQIQTTNGQTLNLEQTVGI